MSHTLVFLKYFTYTLIVILYSCGNDSDDNIINFVPDNTIINPEPEIDPTETVLYLEINDFIWENLNQYYYWQNEVSDLSDEELDSKVKKSLKRYGKIFAGVEDAEILE